MESRATLVEPLMLESAIKDGAISIPLDGLQSVDDDLKPNIAPKASATESKPKDAKEHRVGFFELFRFASRVDKGMTFVGLLCAIVNGVMQPLMTIPMSSILGAFLTYSPGREIPPGAPGSKEFLEDEVRNAVIILAALGAIGFVTGYFQYTLLLVSAERQLRTLRATYFLSVLRKDAAWSDNPDNGSGGIASRLQSDAQLVRDGMAEKLGVVVQASVQMLAGIIISYTKGWKMALIATSTMPIFILVAMTMGINLTSLASKQQTAYASAAAVAEQSISNVRTVVAFDGQARDAARFATHVTAARSIGAKIGLVSGMGMGGIFAAMFSSYGLTFWYGSTLVDGGEYTPAQVFNVFYSLLIGIFAIGQVAPELSALAVALGAAHRIWTTIDTQSPIDPLSADGERPSSVTGRIELHTVAFSYPTRQDAPVLDALDLVVETGQTVAIVGPSGSGKSTIARLIQRFYDPRIGTVMLDSRDIKELNVKWLREQIGVVNQEPVLFEGTIRSNILLGIPDSSIFDNKVLDDMVSQALHTANADFVRSLPEGVETNVGERGTKLSGGQKQRIAIARAIISNPKILLLDEATSALDTAAERQVQTALDQASANRTTIIIAHRLSTVKKADRIVVLDHGKVVETGSHNELLDKNGTYANLVKAQELDIGEVESTVETGGSVRATIRKASSHSVLGTTDSHRGSRSAVAGKYSSQIEVEEDEDSYLNRPMPWTRVFKLNSEELSIIVFGSLGGIAAGSAFPFYSLVMSNMIVALGKRGDELRDGARFYALMFVALGFSMGIAQCANMAFFALSGERLTARIRNMLFTAVLRQEVAFFDDPRHSTGVLTAKLADDATQVKGLFGAMLGVIVQLLSTVVAGLGIALASSWKMTLVLLATFPLLLSGTYLQKGAFSRFYNRGYSGQLATNHIAMEAISNIRTVASLGKEMFFAELYSSELDAPFRNSIKASVSSGFGAGAATGMQLLVFAFAWWYGSTLLVSGEFTVLQIQNSILAVVFSSISVGRWASMIPSLSKAQVATLSIFDILDRVPAVDAEGTDGSQPQSQGETKLANVAFSYPFRNNSLVLDGLNVKADGLKSIAIVGPSGCGKSTALALIERWYDTSAGSVSVDRVDVRDWNLKTLRKNMAIVGQEPVLFEGTIWENIAYGKPDDRGVATQEEIEAAAKKANALEFICNLPEGFQTRVGERGALLSGGQKQRIAIARAIIRRPPLLLLDEATSALDSESEQVVQAALDDASEGRTSITVAHRLSSIQHCNRIFVVQAGKIVEQGSHNELLTSHGLYWELCQQQGLGAMTSNMPLPATIGGL
ncbi:P-loop containing nucleoside triphosphate hydrolase protein [Gonapodya prolifera JEL478]|uniref:p-loop containing nucleoside triphosphate hydrolase protein n=1 Tax=Gonapodya prolifera (strain JEL478) TaxID=1344416 RepID=A0A139AR17_GONPJ|nr:P-loop containing nucleoside triphosphate hydrolase protein [Gonapodya prolifera JEL478]|eukprot:KXS19178.1 P-loop containing nucleoside triphosphate hydrolase protein [Gonapodya prolifera JEL478]